MSFNINVALQAQNITGLKSDIQKEFAGFSVPIRFTIDQAAIRQLDDVAGRLRSVKIGDQVSGGLRSIGAASTTTTASLRTLQTGFEGAKTGAEVFGEQTGLAARRFSAFILSAGLMVRALQAIKAGFGESFEFDKQLVRISQVSEESGSSLRALSADVTNLAVTYGASSKELIGTALIFKQVGISIKEVREQLETIAQASLAPNFDSMAQTAEGAIAILRQFNTDAAGTRDAIGAMNAVAAGFAVEARDLVEAVRRVGGTFKSAGGDVNELLALFTSVRGTTRESAETISTGLRTIFARLQRGTVVEHLKDLGVQLRYTRGEAEQLGQVNLAGQFVGSFEGIRRISQALQGLKPTDSRYAAAIEELGGYRQISKVIPLLTQFTESQRALNVAQAGGITLSIAAEKAQDSLGGRASRVREEYLALIRTITESKGFQDAARFALDFASSLAQVLEIVRPLVPVLTSLAAIKITQSLLPFIGGVGREITYQDRTGPLKRAEGGPIHKFNSGGLVPGHSVHDDKPSLLMGGEYVFDAASVRNVGKGRMAAFHQAAKANKFAGGGNLEPNVEAIHNHIRRLETLESAPKSPFISRAESYLQNLGIESPLLHGFQDKQHRDVIQNSLERQIAVHPDRTPSFIKQDPRGQANKTQARGVIYTLMAMQAAKDAGLVLPNSISAAPFSPGDTAIARAFPDSRILLNTDRPELYVPRLQKRSFAEKWTSTPHPLHSHLHELFHIYDYENGPSNYVGNTSIKSDFVKSNLSQYASKNRSEFVAEYLTAKFVGRELHPALDDIYKSHKGPDIEFASLAKVQSDSYKQLRRNFSSGGETILGRADSPASRESLLSTYMARKGKYTNDNLSHKLNKLPDDAIQRIPEGVEFIGEGLSAAAFATPDKKKVYRIEPLLHARELQRPPISAVLQATASYSFPVQNFAEGYTGIVEELPYVTPLSDMKVSSKRTAAIIAGLRKRAASEGYDWYDRHAGNVGRTDAGKFVIMDPGKIEKKRGYAEGGEAVRLSGGSLIGGPFYSQLERAITSLPPSIKTQSLIPALTKQGVTKEELQWSGFGQQLKGERVSREAVQEHFAANRPNIQEVLRHNDTRHPPIEWTQSDGVWRNSISSKVIRNEHGQWFVGIMSGDRFVSYGLDSEPMGSLQEAQGYVESHALANIVPPQRPRYSDRQTPGWDNYQESLITLPGISPAYQSPHWSEPNVLAHIRFNEREIGGKRALHVEEIQSDWHQEARDKGYRSAFAERLASEKSELTQLIIKKQQAEALIGTDPEAFRDYLNYHDQAERKKRRYALIKEEQEKSVPDAPFKDSWPSLAFKRAVHLAAHGGFDQLTWNTGEQIQSLVGGELPGQQQFYGSATSSPKSPTLPSIASKLGKKFGVQVGVQQIAEGVPAFSLPITPEMKGQFALFNQGGEAAQRLALGGEKRGKLSKFMGDFLWQDRDHGIAIDEMHNEYRATNAILKSRLVPPTAKFPYDNWEPKEELHGLKSSMIEKMMERGLVRKAFNLPPSALTKKLAESQDAARNIFRAQLHYKNFQETGGFDYRPNELIPEDFYADGGRVSDERTTSLIVGGTRVKISSRDGYNTLSLNGMKVSREALESMGLNAPKAGEPARLSGGGDDYRKLFPLAEQSNQSVKSYAYSSIINDALYQGEKLSKTEQMVVKNISNHIESRGGLPDDLTLYRGIGQEELASIRQQIGVAPHSPKAIGGTFSHPAFMSTSLSEEVAGGFGNLLRIKAKKGAKGTGVNPGEQEVLFTPGQQLKLTGNKGGILDVEMLATGGRLERRREKNQRFLEKHGLEFRTSFDLDERGEMASGRVVLAKGKKVYGSSTFYPDGLAQRVHGEKVEGGKDVPWMRIGGIELNPKLRGRGLGAELYLRTLGAMGSNPFFFNSQISPLGAASLSSLQRRGLIDYQDLGYGSHTKQITEKGREYLDNNRLSLGGQPKDIPESRLDEMMDKLERRIQTAAPEQKVKLAENLEAWRGLYSGVSAAKQGWDRKDAPLFDSVKKTLAWHKEGQKEYRGFASGGAIIGGKDGLKKRKLWEDLLGKYGSFTNVPRVPDDLFYPPVIFSGEQAYKYTSGKIKPYQVVDTFMDYQLRRPDLAAESLYDPLVGLNKSELLARVRPNATVAPKIRNYASSEFANVVTRNLSLASKLVPSLDNLREITITGGGSGSARRDSISIGSEKANSPVLAHEFVHIDQHQSGLLDVLDKEVYAKAWSASDMQQLLRFGLTREEAEVDLRQGGINSTRLPELANYWGSLHEVGARNRQFTLFQAIKLLEREGLAGGGYANFRVHTPNVTQSLKGYKRFAHGGTTPKTGLLTTPSDRATYSDLVDAIRERSDLSRGPLDYTMALAELSLRDPDVASLLSKRAKFAGSGIAGLVFDSQDGYVLRIQSLSDDSRKLAKSIKPNFDSSGLTVERPQIPEVLQATDSKRVGNTFIEKVPKVLTAPFSGDITDERIDLGARIYARGFEFSDRHEGNIGRIPKAAKRLLHPLNKSMVGNLVVIDPGAVTDPTTLILGPTPRVKKAAGGPIFGLVPGVGDTDSVPTDLPVGSFVIKKASAQKIGYHKLAAARFAQGGKQQQMVPALVMPGEWIFSPDEAARIGAPALHRMNSMGDTSLLKFATGGSVGRTRFADGNEVTGDGIRNRVLTLSAVRSSGNTSLVKELDDELAALKSMGQNVDRFNAVLVRFAEVGGQATAKLEKMLVTEEPKARTRKVTDEQRALISDPANTSFLESHISGLRGTKRLQNLSEDDIRGLIPQALEEAAVNLNQQKKQRPYQPFSLEKLTTLARAKADENRANTQVTFDDLTPEQQKLVKSDETIKEAKRVIGNIVSKRPDLATGRQDPVDDILGLTFEKAAIPAAQKYDPSKGVKFTTFLGGFVLNAVRSEIAKLKRGQGTTEDINQVAQGEASTSGDTSINQKILESQDLVTRKSTPVYKGKLPSADFIFEKKVLAGKRLDSAINAAPNAPIGLLSSLISDIEAKKPDDKFAPKIQQLKDILKQRTAGGSSTPTPAGSTSLPLPDFNEVTTAFKSLTKLLNDFAGVVTSASKSIKGAVSGLDVTTGGGKPPRPPRKPKAPSSPEDEPDFIGPPRPRKPGDADFIGPLPQHPAVGQREAMEKLRRAPHPAVDQRETLERLTRYDLSGQKILGGKRATTPAGDTGTYDTIFDLTGEPVPVGESSPYPPSDHPLLDKTTPRGPTYIRPRFDYREASLRRLRRRAKERGVVVPENKLNDAADVMEKYVYGQPTRPSFKNRKAKLEEYYAERSQAPAETNIEPPEFPESTRFQKLVDKFQSFFGKYEGAREVRPGADAFRNDISRLVTGKPSASYNKVQDIGELRLQEYSADTVQDVHNRAVANKRLSQGGEISRVTAGNVINRELEKVQKDFIEAEKKALAVLYPRIQAEERARIAADRFADFQEGKIKSVFDKSGRSLGSESAVLSVAAAGKENVYFDNGPFPSFKRLGSSIANAPKNLTDFVANSSLGRGASRLTEALRPAQALATPLLFSLPYAAAGLSQLGGDAKTASLAGNEASYQGTKASSGAIEGILVGSTFAAIHPLLGAFAALTFGVRGFVNSLREAHEELKQVRIDQSLQTVSDRLSELAGGGRRPVGQELTQAFADIRQNTAEKNVSESGGILRSVGSYLGLSDSYNIRDFGARQQKSFREQFGPQLPSLLQVLSSSARDFARQNVANNQPLRVGEGLPDIVRDGNNGFNREAIQTVATIRKVPTSVIENDLIKQIQSAQTEFNLDKKRRDASSTNEPQLNAYVRLSLAIQAASDSLQLLQVRSQAVATVFEGLTPSAIRVTAQVDNLNQIGRQDQGINTPLALLRNTGSPIGADLARTGQAVDQVAVALRQALVEVSRENVAEGGDVTDKVRESVTRQLGPLSADQRNILNVVQHGLAQSFSQQEGHFQGALHDLFIDVSKTADKLIAPALEPLKESAARAARGMEEQANRFIDGLARVRQFAVQLGETLDASARARVSTIRAETEVRADREGNRRSALSYIPLDVLQSANAAQQARLVGGTPEQNADPRFIAAQLQRVNLDIERATQTQQTRFVGQQDFTAAATSLRNLQNRSADLQQALKNLADVANRNAAVQEKLTYLDNERNARTSFGERYLTADQDERFNINRGLLLLNRANTQGSFNGFLPQDIRAAVSAGRSIGDITSPVLGGKGNDVVDRLIRTTQGGVFNLPQDLDRERNRLLQQLVQNSTTGEEALKGLAGAQRSAQEGFFANLTTQNAQFLSELQRIFAQDKVRDLENRQAVLQRRLTTLGESGGRVNLLNAIGVNSDDGLERFRQRRESIRQNIEALAEGLRANETASRRVLSYEDVNIQQRAGIQEPRDRSRALFQEAFGNASTPEVAGEAQTKLLTLLQRDFGDLSATIFERFRGSLVEGNIGTSDQLRSAIVGVLRENTARENARRVDPIVNSLNRDGLNVERITERLNSGGIGEFRSLFDNIQGLPNSFSKLREQVAELNAELSVVTDSLRASRVNRLPTPRDLDFVGPPVPPPTPQNIASLVGGAAGGALPLFRAKGGPIFAAKGTDVIPTMLSEGEFVVNAQSAKNNASLLNRINTTQGSIQGELSESPQWTPQLRYSQYAPEVSPARTPARVRGYANGGTVDDAYSDLYKKGAGYSLLGLLGLHTTRLAQRFYQGRQPLSDVSIDRILADFSKKVGFDVTKIIPRANIDVVDSLPKNAFGSEPFGHYDGRQNRITSNRSTVTSRELARHNLAHEFGHAATFATYGSLTPPPESAARAFAETQVSLLRSADIAAGNNYTGPAADYRYSARERLADLWSAYLGGNPNLADELRAPIEFDREAFRRAVVEPIANTYGGTTEPISRFTRLRNALSPSNIGRKISGFGGATRQAINFVPSPNVSDIGQALSNFGGATRDVVAEAIASFSAAPAKTGSNVQRAITATGARAVPIAAQPTGASTPITPDAIKALSVVEEQSILASRARFARNARIASTLRTEVGPTGIRGGVASIAAGIGAHVIDEKLKEAGFGTVARSPVASVSTVLEAAGAGPLAPVVAGLRTADYVLENAGSPDNPFSRRNAAPRLLSNVVAGGVSQRLGGNLAADLVGGVTSLPFEAVESAVRIPLALHNQFVTEPLAAQQRGQALDRERDFETVKYPDFRSRWQQFRQEYFRTNLARLEPIATEGEQAVDQTGFVKPSTVDPRNLQGRAELVINSALSPWSRFVSNPDYPEFAPVKSFIDTTDFDVDRYIIKGRTDRQLSENPSEEDLWSEAYLSPAWAKIQESASSLERLKRAYVDFAADLKFVDEQKGGITASGSDRRLLDRVAARNRNGREFITSPDFDNMLQAARRYRQIGSNPDLARAYSYFMTIGTDVDLRDLDDEQIARLGLQVERNQLFRTGSTVEGTALARIQRVRQIQARLLRENPGDSQLPDGHRELLGGVPGFANGGPIGQDRIPAYLSEGEYVVNREGARNNASLLNHINSGRPVYFDEGGAVGSPASVLANTPSSWNYSLNYNTFTDADKATILGAFDRKSDQPKFTSETRLNALERNVSGLSPARFDDTGLKRLLADNSNAAGKNVGEATRSNSDLQKKFFTHLGGLHERFFDRFTRQSVTNVVNVSKSDEGKFPVRLGHGGLVQYFADGGHVGFAPRGTDTIPAMLSKGEFVVNAQATKANLNLLHQINRSKSPVYLSTGGMVPDRTDKIHGDGQIPAMLTPNEFVVNADAAQKNHGLLSKINAAKGAYRPKYYYEGGSVVVTDVAGSDYPPNVIQRAGKAANDAYLSDIMPASLAIAVRRGRASQEQIEEADRLKRSHARRLLANYQRLANLPVAAPEARRDPIQVSPNNPTAAFIEFQQQEVALKRKQQSLNAPVSFQGGVSTPEEKLRQISPPPPREARINAAAARADQIAEEAYGQAAGGLRVGGFDVADLFNRGRRAFGFQNGGPVYLAGGGWAGALRRVNDITTDLQQREAADIGSAEREYASADPFGASGRNVLQQGIIQRYLSRGYSQAAAEEAAGRAAIGFDYTGSVSNFAQRSALANSQNPFAYFGIGKADIGTQTSLQVQALARKQDFRDKFSKRDFFKTGVLAKNTTQQARLPVNYQERDNLANQILSEDQRRALTFQRRFADGGPVGTDTIPAWLSPGEYVLRSAAVQKAGLPFLNALNTAQHFAGGGPVGVSEASSFGVNPEFAKAVQSFGANLEQLSGFNNVFQGSVQSFGVAVNSFGTAAHALASALEKFPSTLQVQGQQTVNVNINGAEVIGSIQGDLKKMVEDSVNSQIRNVFRQVMPEAGVHLT